MDASAQRHIRLMWTAVVALALLWVITGIWMVTLRQTAGPVLSVERLEIVEPDGTPALVLANSRRPAVATIDGQVLMAGQEEERRGFASIVFFDGKGDEVGGMLFGVRETPEGYRAVRHLSFDAYKHDQTVVLSHTQDAGGTRAGLTVTDRPRDRSLPEALAELGLALGASREQLSAAVQAIPEDARATRMRQLFGTSRVFLGSDRAGEATLILRDGEGRQRIAIEAPRDGEPSIRMFDGEGKVILQLPGPEGRQGAAER